MTQPAVTIVGMGDHGCSSLGALAISRIATASVLMGSTRLLAFFPQFSGRKIPISQHITAFLDEMNSLAHDHTIVVLASHDPLFHGIGARVIAALGAEHVEIIPYPSALQFAFARLKRRWDDATTISLHGHKSLDGLVTRITRLNKVVLLTDNINTPPKIAAHLRHYGDNDWDAYLCENLTGVEEKITRCTLEELAACEAYSPLNLLILIRTGELIDQDFPLIPCQEDESYLCDHYGEGLITKREVRLLALANLHIRSHDILWDVGTGSGAVAIEAAKLAAWGRVYAIEKNSARLALARNNAITHKSDNIIFVEDAAPSAFSGLERPHGIFVGGCGEPCGPLLTAAFDALLPGGKMVITAVTLEKIAAVITTAREIGVTPAATLLSCAKSCVISDNYNRYKPMSPIHLFTLTKDAEGKL